MRPYRDSVVVAKTVRAVAPFVFTFGLFTMFHGTKSVGGGFQGGVVVAALVVTLAFAFGVEQTWAGLDARALVVVAAAGVLVFGFVALGSLALAGSFLDVTAFPGSPAYPIEAVELGIGVAVATVISVVFFELAGVGS
ncbi:MnhB domain-containing protein [Haloglomus litoreum]|uniref:MnhB domain-containing protein n=1 Tax=Haloglomus litoreum TaxID=3034026 RepID=UPI0023E7CDB6|nr:MnhB domain-containing protein [Haloglomus sp. DT116]